MCVYLYIYILVCMCIYIHTYIYTIVIVTCLFVCHVVDASIKGTELHDRAAPLTIVCLYLVVYLLVVLNCCLVYMHFMLCYCLTVCCANVYVCLRLSSNRL